MSVRLIPALLCIVSAGGLGFLKGQRMRKRIRMLEKLARMLDHMARELEFGREPLPQIFGKLSRKNAGQLQLFLQAVSKELAVEDVSMGDIFSRNIRRYMEGGDLSGDDLKRLYGFGSELGYPDRQLQIHTVEIYRQEISALVEELKKQYPQSCRLFRTLGMTAGILLAVLLW